MSLLKQLIHEAHRRSLWQVLGIYGVAAWISYEVILGLVDGLGLPDWVPPFAVVLFLIGLPIVLATAFVQEGMGSGEDGTSERAAVGGTDAGAEVREGAGGRRDAGSPRDSGPDRYTGAEASPGFHEHLLTWRNALLGGLAAFTLLGLLAGGYLVMWRTGIGPVGSLVAQGVLDERDAVVLAEFDNATPDALLGDVVTEALRVDLLESRVITVVDPAYLRGVLDRMERDPSERLTAELAREVALREGIKAVVSGDVGALGDGYVLTARIVATEDGRSLAAFRETAGGDGELVDAVDRLSQRIRERAGESLRQIRAGQPLSAVTTSSLEALRLYTAALRADEEGDEDRAVGLLEDAVEVDAEFAMAYRKMAAIWSNRGDRPRMREYATRAFELRDRLTVRERYLAEGLYYQMVTDDLERARRSYESILELHPDDPTALNNLGLAVGDAGDLEGAEALYLRAVSGPGRTRTAQGNLVDVRLQLGDLAGAREALTMLEQHYPSTPTFYSYAYHVAADEGRYDEADSVLAVAGERFRDQSGLPGTVAIRRGMLRGVQGRLAEAREFFAEGEALAEAQDIPGQRNWAALIRAELELQVAEDTAAALAVIDAYLRRHPLEEMDPGFRPTIWLAFLYAEAGAPDRAERFLEMAREDAAEAERDEVGDAFARAVVARARGDEATALATIREARRMPECSERPGCGLVELAFVHDQAGAADSAVVHYEAYLETPGAARFQGFWREGPKVLERLGQLHEELGNPEKAAEYFARFSELWADADAELQPRVERARERAAELGALPEPPAASSEP